MTQTTPPRGGWQQEEIDLLFSAVKEAAENGRPLRDVFSEVGGQLSRKPNSIRNFYYARVREVPQLAARQAPLRTFTAEEPVSYTHLDVYKRQAPSFRRKPYRLQSFSRKA